MPDTAMTDPRLARVDAAFAAIDAAGLPLGPMMAQAAVWWTECLEPLAGGAGPTVGWQNGGDGPWSALVDQRLRGRPSGVIAGLGMARPVMQSNNALLVRRNSLSSAAMTVNVPTMTLLQPLLAHLRADRGIAEPRLVDDRSAAALLEADPVYRRDPWIPRGPGHAQTTRAHEIGGSSWMTGNSVVHAAERFRARSATTPMRPRRGEVTIADLALTGTELERFVADWARCLRHEAAMLVEHTVVDAPTMA